jgi:Ca2+-binding EF-hand superfamily protein
MNDMKTILIAAAVIAAALFTLPVVAQEKSADKEMIDKAFDGMDTNKDGSIDRAELGVYLQAIVDKQRADFEAGFVEMDVNKDGKIDKEEAKANTVLATYFDPLDTDKDGFLSKAEMDAALEAAAKAKN